MVHAGFKHVRIFCPKQRLKYHLQNYKTKGKTRGTKKIFNHRHSLGNIFQKKFGVIKAHFSRLKRMALYTLQIEILIVVVAIMLYNYIRHEAQVDWLFERYGNKEMIVINIKDEVGDEKTLPGFMPSHSVVRWTHHVHVTDLVFVER